MAPWWSVSHEQLKFHLFFFFPFPRTRPFLSFFFLNKPHTIPRILGARITKTAHYWVQRAQGFISYLIQSTVTFFFNWSMVDLQCCKFQFNRMVLLYIWYVCVYIYIYIYINIYSFSYSFPLQITIRCWMFPPLLRSMSLLSSFLHTAVCIC